MKKIHILEVIAVSFVLILILYFSIPFFLHSQLAKKISRLKEETQTVVDLVERHARQNSRKKYQDIETENIFAHYLKSNTYGIYAGRGGLNTTMIELTKQNPHESEPGNLYVMLLGSNINPRRTGFTDFVTVSLSSSSHTNPLNMSSIKQLDEDIRDTFIAAQKNGMLDLQPAIHFLCSKSYDVSNGLSSSGFILSYQYTKVPYEE